MGRSWSRFLLASPPWPEADERFGIEPHRRCTQVALLPPPPPLLQYGPPQWDSLTGLTESESREISDGSHSLSVDGSGRRTSKRVHNAERRWFAKRHELDDWF
mmetsp:Transcript_19816/g.37298  ORF Transcript_19816/g.37298 Transcript_19816/m.37298 type:complete len:103 (-) Transcript_19816:247-555(-)